MADIGIDLGTTNSAVAHLRNTPEIIENRSHQTTPSAVAFDEDEGELLVGHSAKDQAMVLPSVLSVKRHMGTDKTFKLGGKSYGPEELSAVILKDLIQAAKDRLNEPIDSAVITIPAYFNTAQNEATKKAGELAGVKNVRLLAEPIAAALAHGGEDMVLVYDLGGGTFDVAIIDCYDYKMVSLDGDNYLGGDDFDARLMAHLDKQVKEKFQVSIEDDPQAKQMAKSACEKAKKALSEKATTKIFFQSQIKGKPINISLKVTREEFEEMIKDLVDRTLEKVENAIKLAAKGDAEISGKQDIGTVMLVGGSTYIPLVQRRLTEFFGKEPSKKINPDLAVSLGAAVHTASGAAKKGEHRLLLRPAPVVTAEKGVKLSGRTTPGSRVEVTGGATTSSGEADQTGKFQLACDLKPNAVNDITVTATSPGGEKRTGGCQVRHDEKHSGKAEFGHRPGKKVGGGKTARPFGIAVTGQDYQLGVIIPSQTDIPHVATNQDYAMTSNEPNQAGKVPIMVFEGDIPFAPLNTLLGVVILETAATPSTQERLDIKFHLTEDRLLKVTARLADYPDQLVTAELRCESPTGEKLHVLDRADRVLNVHSDKMRPEEKAKLKKSRQALLDVCEQFRREPKEDRYEQIKKIGVGLREDLDRIEAACG